MLSRMMILAGVVLLLALSALFFAVNSSYQDSFQARVFYFLGDYDQAHTLSKRAYEADAYNKMAFTVLTQSTIALKYEAYIHQGNAYLEKLGNISAKEEISEADRSRIRMMCEVMRDAYHLLSPTQLTDESLQESAREVYDKFDQLYTELF